MRIIAGRWRGTRLAGPGRGEDGLRPTTDRVRESLFSILAGGRLGDPIAGARVLDLFAGTGALGLEALSRGAASATFVERGRKAARLIRDNIAHCPGADARLIVADATRLDPDSHAGHAHDLVFLDPPYGKGLGEAALTAALTHGWIAPGALVVWEEGTAIAPPPGLSLLDSRRFGDTQITFLRAGD